MEKLRECPCCGKPGEMKTVYQRFRHGWIGCPACGLYMQWKNDPAAAIARWNMRWNMREAPHPPLRGTFPQGKARKEELPRGCFNCEYSRAGYQALRCFGQKGAPAVRPDDLCEAWKLAGGRE